MMRKVTAACALAVALLMTCGAGGSVPAGAGEYKGGDALAAAFYRGPRGGGFAVGAAAASPSDPRRFRRPGAATMAADAAITAAVATTVGVATAAFIVVRAAVSPSCGAVTVAAAITAADTAPVTTAADIVRLLRWRLSHWLLRRRWRLLRRRIRRWRRYHRVLRRLRRRRLFRRRLLRWRLQRRWLLRCRLLRWRLRRYVGYGYGGGYGYGYGYGYGGCHTAYIPYGWTWYRATSC